VRTAEGLGFEGDFLFHLLRRSAAGNKNMGMGSGEKPWPRGETDLERKRRFQDRSLVGTSILSHFFSSPNFNLSI